MNSTNTRRMNESPAMDTNLIFQRLQALPEDQRTLAVGFILGLSAQQAQENDCKDTKQ